MKLRHSTKRRIASALARRQGRRPWTAEEVACMDSILRQFDSMLLSRVFDMPRIKQGQSFAVWRPRAYL